MVCYVCWLNQVARQTTTAIDCGHLLIFGMNTTNVQSYPFIRCGLLNEVINIQFDMVFRSTLVNVFSVVYMCSNGTWPANNFSPLQSTDNLLYLHNIRFIYSSTTTYISHDLSKLHEQLKSHIIYHKQTKALDSPNKTKLKTQLTHEGDNENNVSSDDWLHFEPLIYPITWQHRQIIYPVFYFVLV